MKPTILFVTEVAPCPPHGGQQINTYNLIDCLAEHASLIVLTSKPVPADCELRSKVVDWYTFPKYSIAWWAKLTNFRAVLAPRASWIKCLQAICQIHQPVAAWFSHGYWGQYVPPLRNQGIGTVMCTQNIESHLTRMRAANTSWGREYVVTWLRTWAEKRHEEQLFQNFDYLVSVSEKDRCYHAQFVGEERSVLIPNYVDETQFLPVERVGRADHLLVMTGSFHNFQNSEGARWFVQEIWPRILAVLPQTKLQLIGSGADRMWDILQQIGAVTDQVECIQDVPSIAPYLRHATLAVVPLLHGGGTRLKILEAWACETPVVSTTLGAAGLVHREQEGIRLADEADEFAQAVIDLLQNPQVRTTMAEQSLTVLRADYTARVNSNRLKQLLDRI